jgi:ATPase subunit of ABC transporter with duplicated ATPase domains
LSGASFALRPGDKAGLVGRNGAGKTSMLAVLAGHTPPAQGLVSRGEAVGYLPQDPKARGAGVDATALSHILSGRGLDDAARRLEKLHAQVDEDPSERNVRRFSDAEESFRASGGYAAEAEVHRIAAGLGLPGDRLALPLPVLSGGERRRVELARILFAGSDLLLLDEPTNHLDTDAKQWLIAFLRSYRGALLVVSHDLALLDTAITRILHLDEGELIEYRGTYSQYRVARAADEERLGRLASRQQQEMKRLKTLADSMRGQTVKRARTAKTIDKRVQRLAVDAVEGPRRERTMRVRLPEPPRPGATVLEADGLAKRYGDRPPVFEDVTFTVGRAERLLVMGFNGAGKTSLMRVLAGVTDADAGEHRLGHGVSLGYYAQEHEGLVPGKAVLAHLRDEASGTERELRALLGMMGLSGDIAHQDAATLSGGEKTKLALAMLVAGRHNLLLLDEPTNNLDPPSRVAVANALASWTGSLVIVSHDREFVEELRPDRVLLMPDGTLDHWNDEMADLVELA